MVNQSQYWTFVINNPAKSDWEFMTTLGEDGNIEFLVFQQELGDKGTQHLQGYVCLRMKRRFNSFRKLHDTWHIEARKGSHDECLHYHTKPHPGCECKHCYKILVL